MILLQVGKVELNNKEVVFEHSFEGLDEEQYYLMLNPVKGSRRHHRWLEGSVNLLTRANLADYIANTIKRIIKFLQME